MKSAPAALAEEAHWVADLVKLPSGSRVILVHRSGSFGWGFIGLVDRPGFSNSHAFFCMIDAKLL